jgi:NAD(P)-dependent dehydrogenase (short-subunit alcohol dehydrogenase family)
VCHVVPLGHQVPALHAQVQLHLDEGVEGLALQHLDAVVSAAGNVHFAPLEDMTEQHSGIGLRDKLMGQVNLAMIGRAWLNDGGSITVTGGILSEQPIRNGSSASMVNSALEGFVRGAAIELPRGLRINLVSPNVVREPLPRLAPFFRGFEAVAAARVDRAALPRLLMRIFQRGHLLAVGSRRSRGFTD